MKLTRKILREMIEEELLKESGRFRLSHRAEMHWGSDKVVIKTGKSKAILTKKELYNLLRGAKMHRLGGS